MKSSRSGNRLEVKVEFTAVTGFRKSLLTIIPRLQKNEYLRFIITRHGKPAAVVMSYEAYDLLQSLAQELADQDRDKSPEQRLAESYDRMSARYGRPEDSVAAASAADAKAPGGSNSPSTRPESQGDLSALTKDQYDIILDGLMDRLKHRKDLTRVMLATAQKTETSE